MSDENGREAGFEFQGRVYPWRVSDIGKDLMLIERFSGMSFAEFVELADEATDASRPSILLSMIATSLRAGNPSWSVERITRLVMELSIGTDITMIVADEEDEQELPPAPAAGEAASTGNGSSGASRPTSSPTAAAASETSNATPV